MKGNQKQATFKGGWCQLLEGFLEGCGKTQWVRNPHCDLTNGAGAKTARWMLKMAVQRGRSERRGVNRTSVSYVEPLNDARTKLAGFFSDPARRIATVRRETGD
jgi:hypothetical protein